MASGPPPTTTEQPISDDPASPVPAPSDKPSAEPGVDEESPDVPDSTPTEPVWPD